ncbi:MAG: hypothetical protein H7Y09_03920 [Chitinophagaceae bacterium]|nr:hypothetical protein [Anaerolineae bacterium]
MKKISLVDDLQLFDALETRLGRLAARWRGTQDPHEAETIVREYQTILLRMIE